MLSNKHSGSHDNDIIADARQEQALFHDFNMLFQAGDYLNIEEEFLLWSDF